MLLYRQLKKNILSSIKFEYLTALQSCLSTASVTDLHDNVPGVKNFRDYLFYFIIRF